VAVCASGNYAAGAIWPPIVQHFIETVGWRHTYFGLAAFSLVTMTALALFMRRRPPALTASGPGAAASPIDRLRAGQNLVCFPASSTPAYFLFI
jgi:predicted MFS family arabinose efflux permease